MTNEEKVKQIIADQLQVLEEEVVPTADLREDLSADSLDIMELVTDLEDQFDIEIPDGDVETFNTVKDVLDYIETKV